MEYGHFMLHFMLHFMNVHVSKYVKFPQKLVMLHFLKEWQPFPPNHPSCGPDYVTGVGGEITSPGYPNVYEPDVECTWMLRVEDDMFILLNFIDLDLGQSGRFTSRQYRHFDLNSSNEEILNRIVLSLLKPTNAIALVGVKSDKS